MGVTCQSFIPYIFVMIVLGKVRGSTLIIVQDLQTNVVCDHAKQCGQQCYALVKSTRSYHRSSTMEGYHSWLSKRGQDAVRQKRSER